MMHIAENQEALLDYLYEEGDSAERIRIAQHLQECAPCSVAVLELQSVRGLLSGWTPPPVSLGFKVVQTADTSAPAARPPARWPAWAQAAAAVMLFIAGMAASQVQIEYGNGALVVRSRAGGSAPQTEAAVIHAGTDILLSPALVDAGYTTAAPVQPRMTGSAAPSADEMLRRVKALIDQSELRQKRELALRLSDVVHDFDTQRQADMQRVDQNLGQLENQTGAAVAQTQEMARWAIKVSQGK